MDPAESFDPQPDDPSKKAHSTREVMGEFGGEVLSEGVGSVSDGLVEGATGETEPIPEVQDEVVEVVEVVGEVDVPETIGEAVDGVPEVVGEIVDEAPEIIGEMVGDVSEAAGGVAAEVAAEVSGEVASEAAGCLGGGCLEGCSTVVLFAIFLCGSLLMAFFSIVE